MKKLWICGQCREFTGIRNRYIWDLVGVFSTVEKAVAACRDETYFIYSCILNKQYPDEPVVPPDGYYPKIREEK